MLEGVKVVEYATYIAAPSAGALLAEWGAEVVKVEPPAGCPMRLFLGPALPEGMEVDPVFSLDNRNKRMAVLDTSKEGGYQALVRLVAQADVFLTNVRPSALERAKLDYESLKKHNEGLVYASVSGYGLQGEARDRPGFDITAFFARSGLASASTPKDESPLPPRTGMGDHMTGLAAAGGIAAALYARTRTGKGSVVETGLQGTGMYAFGSDLAVQLSVGRITNLYRRGGFARNPLLSYFGTKDGRWLIMVPRLGSSKEWGKICRALLLDEALAEDERFTGHAARVENREEVLTILEEAFARFTLAEVGARMEEQDLVWSAVLTADEVVADPQVSAAGALVDVKQNGKEGYRSVAGPVRFNGKRAEYQAPATLGADTEEVLQASGMTKEEIASLRSEGALG